MSSNRKRHLHDFDCSTVSTACFNSSQTTKTTHLTCLWKFVFSSSSEWTQSSLETAVLLFLQFLASSPLCIYATDQQTLYVRLDPFLNKFVFNCTIPVILNAITLPLKCALCFNLHESHEYYTKRAGRLYFIYWVLNLRIF